MKKNIQINLFGTLYNIDDDAYMLLERYLDSMKRYFAHQDGGEEIADDIEHRVAELLWQKKNEGMVAVDIETVKEIIAKIGNPQEIDDAADAGNTAESGEPQDAEYEEVKTETHESFAEKVRNNVRGRRLYRNGDDKKIAGVCSGLAEYTGMGDSTLWRLAFVFLPFALDAVLSMIGFSGSGVFGLFFITYLLLALVVPLAKTPEDNLRMKGCEVTPENINEEILRETSEKKQKVVQTSNGSGCLTILLVCVLVVFLFPLIMLLIAFVLANGLWFGDGMLQTLRSNMGYLFDNEGWMFISAIVAVVLVFAIPVMLIVKKLRTGRFGAATTCISLVVWLLMLGWTVISVIEGFDQLKARNISITTDDYEQSDDTDDSQMTDNTGEMDELTDSVAIDLWGGATDSDDDEW